MKKEVLFAIIAGSILGLIIAFGIWKVNSALRLRSDQDNKTSQTSPPPKEEFGITLANVDNLNVVGVSPFTLKGITKPEVWLITSTQEKDYLTTSDKKGEFAQEVNFLGGINSLVFTAIEKDGKTAVTKLSLVYSTQLEAEEPTQITPKAVVGVVTDISESSIQLKDEKGEIKQISSENPDQITVVRSEKTGKEMALKDIAIGDYLVAMGYLSKNGNGGVLLAKRILITQPVSPIPVEITMGAIEKITPKDITVKGNTYAIKKDTKIKLSDLEEGQNIILVSLKKDDIPTIRTVFQLPNSD